MHVSCCEGAGHSGKGGLRVSSELCSWREHSRRKLSPTLATPTTLVLTTLVAVLCGVAFYSITSASQHLSVQQCLHHHETERNATGTFVCSTIVQLHGTPSSESGRARPTCQRNCGCTRRCHRGTSESGTSVESLSRLRRRGLPPPSTSAKTTMEHGRRT